MRIALCVKENSIETEVDGRFGRCRYFAVVDLVKGQVDFIQNEAADESGAGVKAARIIMKSQVDAVVTQNIGPKAFDLLKKANIYIYEGVNSTMQDTIDHYNNGHLKELNAANN